MKLKEMTGDQVEEVFKAFAKHLREHTAGGELANVPFNHSALAGYFIQYNLDVTVENLYKAVNALKKALVWDKKPTDVNAEHAAELAKAEAERVAKQAAGFSPSTSREDSMGSTTYAASRGAIEDREREKAGTPVFQTAEPLPAQYTPSVIKKLSTADLKILNAKYGEAVNARLRGEN